MNTNSNKLSESSSPYLLQHSENPVHWQEYSDTLINHPENKQLLIISIGYSACHWCHVMEHESFEDAEVARLMNHHFINIKVDREEYPQVDKVYMQACRLMTGGGGWPLNVICTPDGTPVHAGTYFPKNNWIQLLNTIAKLWKEKPSQVEQFKAKLTSVLIEDNKKESTDLSLVKVLESIDKNTGLLDYNNGGLMGSPKFPMPVLLQNLNLWSVVFGNENLEQFVNLSLLKMMKGGMWDLVEGGFARYSVDEHWFVPHFEKMLYDNAQLLPLYFAAGDRINIPLLTDVGHRIVDFCNANLLQSNGLFAAALDADTDEGEGAYYALTEKEYTAILNTEELEFCSKYMRFSKEGNWENGLNIPVINEPPQRIIQELGMETQDLEDFQKSIFEKFRTLRKSKEKPGLDYKCLCAWNGLMLTGLSKASVIFPTYLGQAKRLADSMSQFCTSNGLCHQISHEKIGHSACLDDYAFFIKGLLDLFETSQQEEYATRALKLTKQALENHLNEDGDLQFQNVSQMLFTPVPDWEDNVVPSAIGTMCANLQILSVLFGLPNYEEISARHISKNHAAIVNHTFWHSQWLSLWLQQKAGNPILVCSNTKAHGQLMAEIGKYLPETMLCINSDSTDLPITQGKSGTTEQYFICLDQTCLEPLKEPGQVLEVLRDYFGYVYTNDGA